MAEEDGMVTAIEFTKSGLPLTLAPTIVDTPNQVTKATITGHDTLLPIVHAHLRRAFNFLQCFFDVSIKVGSVEVSYALETGESEDDLPVPGMTIGEAEARPLAISYDFITRSLMAAETDEPPEFVASLAGLAREALNGRRFIDSFRYSFLLIEALFGRGKFKSRQLSDALQNSEELGEAIDYAVSEMAANRLRHPSETATLLKTAPGRSSIIDHLIERRGHYFHGNVKKTGAWSAARQEEAEGLAWFCIDVVIKLSSDAAASMFKPEYTLRHFEESRQNGASVKVRMNIFFREAEGDRLQRQNINLDMSGTKVTNRMAMDALREGIRLLQDDVPAARLHSIVGFDDQAKKRLFDVRMHIEPDDPKPSV
ncbi:hypothetical protein [Sphingomonas sp. S-NIH.Pt15_0812]|uniref:hypothetical protein n=1 Tax=Sphingomonas sp. S-NIH.Pt15_0812 TaxID=1920129 RepID=UPI000F7E7035|nr:hypothetical protein [Sphingomonas sp. S-NIH.Pt15_0812]